MGDAQVAQSLGLLIGATVLDAKVAQTVAAVIMLTMMLARPPASLYTVLVFACNGGISCVNCP